MENSIELHAIQTKMKRLLIPIIGKGLSSFWNHYRSDLNTIHSSVSRLAKSQEEIVHVIGQYVLVII